jgi:hypothetical protein
MWNVGRSLATLIVFTKSPPLGYRSLAQGKDIPNADMVAASSLLPVW